MISVIVPTLNRPEMLAECLRSIMEQTETDFETIVINDGGNPVEEVIKPFAPKVKILTNNVSKGPPAALNRGIKASEGSYIALCDDDDTWHREHLRQLKSVLGGAPQPGLVYSDVCARDSTMTRVLGFLERDFDLAFLRETNFIVASSVLFPREIYDDVGGFDESLPYYADWDFFLKVANRFSIQRVEEMLTYYRIHENSHSQVDHARQLARQTQLRELSARHLLGDLPMKHLFDNFRRV